MRSESIFSLRAVTLGLGALAFAGTASADEVLLKNGDRLTGKVTKVQGGKVYLESKSLGKVTLRVAEVEKATLDTPMVFSLKDGSRVEARVLTAEAPKARSGPAEGLAIGFVELKDEGDGVGKLNGTLTASYSGVVSNTETQHLRADAKLWTRFEGGRLDFDGYYQYATEKKKDQDRSITENRWELGAQYSRDLSNQMYVYGNARYSRDPIRELDRRFIAGAGLGKNFVHNETTTFSGQVGAAYVNEKYLDGSEDRDYVTFAVSYDLTHKLSDNVMFYHDLTWLPALRDQDGTIIYTSAGVQFKLSEAWSLDARVRLDYHSKPAAGVRKDVYHYLVGIAYRF